MATTETDLYKWIEHLPGPGWLADARREAADVDAQTDLPHWDRTDISGLDLSRFILPAGASVEIAAPPEAAQRGVVCGTIAALAESEPELVRRYLGRIVAAEHGKFEARNAAAHQGCLVYVPDGVALGAPIQITYRLGEGSAAQFHPRTVIGLGRTAEVNILQREAGGPVGAAESAALVTSVVEADIADGARLNFVELQNWADGVQNFTTRRCELGRDAGVKWLVGELGAGLSRSGTTTVMRGVGGEALALLVFFASGRQHMDLLATLVHHGARTNGLMLAKGVLSGESRAIYRGTSDIKRGAKGSNSQQKEQSLHLTPGVRSDAVPALYIDENELQAGHAATTGKVDPEQLFYLRSRGLPLREAERLIVHGFFAPLVEQIPLKEARQAISDLVDHKIGPSA